MMMSLDTFVFEIGTLPYQQMVRDRSWRFAAADRFGARPAVQYLGPGDDSITLTGAIYPGQIGRWSSFEYLAELADTGAAYVLLTGTYEVLGQYSIQRLRVTSELFFVDGAPRKADFSIDLGRVE